MEETSNGRCSVVYFCPGHDTHKSVLYNPSNLPVQVTSTRQPLAPSLGRIYNNVRRLLDPDMGDFEQVFVSPSLEKSQETLLAFANSRPTAVLVELSDSTDGEQQDAALKFLHQISADPHKLEYRQPVMPLLLMGKTLGPDDDTFPGSTEQTNLLTVQSPLDPEAINQLVGHVKETVRPSAHSIGAGMARNLAESIADKSKPQIASHRPDQSLSAQRKATVAEAVSKWQFPAHDFDMDELTYGALLMLEHVLQNSDLESYRLPRAELMTFLLFVRRQYRHEREVHYHNWRHAVDVTQSLYCFLCDTQLCPPLPTSPQKQKPEINALERLLSPIEALILLVSAVGHDVGHPGVNNAFLVACGNQLAHVYNDKSVLENYHCAAYTQVLRRHWPSLSTIPNFRPTMISTILATDMQRHFEYMGHLNDLKQKIQKSDSNLADWNDKDKDHARELMMALLIKAADISNVARPFEISAQWARILMNEFSRQGELENELGIPTCLFGGPPNKGDTLAAAQSQKGFMNLFGFPLFRGISEIMPNVSCTLPELEINKEVWEKTINEENSRREALGDGQSSPRTYGSVTGKEVEEARMRKRESEPNAVPIPVPQTPTSPHQRQMRLDDQNTPTKHPASAQRHHLQLGFPLPGEEKRASAPALWPSSVQLSPIGGSSRRSSKDVALHHLQELSAIAQQTLTTGGSRRSSADASWQLHQNYPGSRRGSKDESLTTILVTSQNSSPASRSVPSSPKIGRSPSSTKVPGATIRNSSMKQSSSTARYSEPPSRSHTASPTAGTPEHASPSTQPSSLAPTDEGSNTALQLNNSSGRVADNAEIEPSDRLHALDGMRLAKVPAALPATPPEAFIKPAVISGSPQTSDCMTSEDSALSLRDDRKSDPQIRESRSRSRLRGLKFWKRRKSMPGIEGASTDSASP